MREGLSYAMEENDNPLELHIYTGSDGEFLYYDDAGNDYSYEKKEYETVRLSWTDSSRVLTLSNREGSFKGMIKNRKIKLFINGQFSKNIDYTGEELKVSL